MGKKVTTVKYQRGIIGKTLKYLFIGYNALMVFWLIGYWTEIGGDMGTGSDAEQAGAAIGSFLGTGMILFVWGLGDVILGIPVLLTRGRRIETTEGGDDE